MSHRALLPLLLALAVALAAGCEDCSGDKLRGKTWVLVSFTDADGTVVTPEYDQALVFEDGGELKGNYDCNMVTGTYEPDCDNKLRIRDVFMTALVCPENDTGAPPGYPFKLEYVFRYYFYDGDLILVTREGEIDYEAQEVNLTGKENGAIRYRKEATP